MHVVRANDRTKPCSTWVHVVLLVFPSNQCRERCVAGKLASSGINVQGVDVYSLLPGASSKHLGQRSKVSSVTATTAARNNGNNNNNSFLFIALMYKASMSVALGGCWNMYLAFQGRFRNLVGQAEALLI